MFYVLGSEQFPSRWEIVYFVTNRCNNNCSHCWSKQNFLGADVELYKHEEIIGSLNPERISTFKLSGGEVTLFPQLNQLIVASRKYLRKTIPIQVFSNGRFLFDTNGKAKHKDAIYEYIFKLLPQNSNISLQVSADEYHIGSFCRKYGICFEDGVNEYNKAIMRAIEIFETYGNESNTLKIKLHCNAGRAQFHQAHIYKDFPKEYWEKYFILTEGLVKAGNGKTLDGTTEIQPSERWSAFIMPGAEFKESPSQLTKDIFNSGIKNYYLDSNPYGKGSVILGWWNLINRKMIGGDLDDFIRFIK